LEIIETLSKSKARLEMKPTRGTVDAQNVLAVDVASHLLNVAASEIEQKRPLYLLVSALINVLKQYDLPVPGDKKWTTSARNWLP
jgi:hypothetical protein